MFAEERAFQASSTISCFPHPFQPPHLVDEGFHDDDSHDGEQFAVLFYTVNLEDDEPLAEQIDVLRGVEQEVVTSRPGNTAAWW